jgi:chromosome partitioning protein
VITITVVSQKGGVGKTITCANLGACLADLGLGVLMVDVDSQADLSASWGVDAEDDRPRIEDALDASATVEDVLEHIGLARGFGSLALLPTAHERLRRQTGRLLAGDGRQLTRVLEPLSTRFDLALIDTPAGDTVFGRQSIVAAELVIVPMLPGYHELRALTRTLAVIEERAGQESTRVDLLGVLVVNADARWRSTKEYRAHLGTMAVQQQLALFDTLIPRHQPVTDHARYGLPTVWLRPGASVAAAYRAVAREIAIRLIDQHGLEVPSGLASSMAALGPESQ